MFSLCRQMTSAAISSAMGIASQWVKPVTASVMMAGKIPGSKLYVYPSFGHAAYEEAKDFNRRVHEFIKD